MIKTILNNKNFLKKFTIFYAINLFILVILSNDIFKNFYEYLLSGSYYPNGFQGMCQYIWENNPLKAVWFQHNQLPLFPFIVGVAMKFNIYPVSIFILNTIFSTLNLILVLEILKKLSKNKLINYVIFFIFLLNPINIYFQFLLGWEMMFSTLILLLILKLIELSNDKFNNLIYLFISIILISLIFLRSTVSVPFIAVMLFLIYFISDKNKFVRIILIPIIISTSLLYAFGMP